MVVGRLKTCPIVPFCWQVSAVASLLPPASFYLIEKSSISVQNTALFPVMAHMRTVEAMLFALLEPRITPPEPNIPPRFEEISRKCKKKTQQLFFMKLLFLYSCCASIPFFSHNSFQCNNPFANHPNIYGKNEPNVHTCTTFF